MPLLLYHHDRTLSGEELFPFIEGVRRIAVALARDLSPDCLQQRDC
jgi:hypothetical protein